MFTFWFLGALIAITAILTAAYNKNQQIQLERERIQQGYGADGSPPALPAGQLQDMQERLANLEAIITSGQSGNADLDQRALQAQLDHLSNRLKALEEGKAASQRQAA